MSILKKARQVARSTRRSSSSTDGKEMESLPHTPRASTQAHEQQPASLATFAQECNTIASSASDPQTKLSSLQSLHRRALHAVNDTAAVREIDTLNTQITAETRTTLTQLKTLRYHPYAASQPYAAHLGLAERSVRDVMQRHTQIEREYQRSLREALERQYRVTMPDATDEEVRAAAHDNDTGEPHQVFAQALMRGDARVSGAKSALGAVSERHEAIQKAERQLVELAELFELMSEEVVRQEYPVGKIEQEAEATREHTEFAVVELGEATNSARKARRKKWTCFWITVGVIVVVLVGAAIALAIIFG